MSKEEDWIKAMDSENPLERIDGRTNVLRLGFLKSADSDTRMGIYFDLSRDIRLKPYETVSYIKDLSQTPEEQAYAIWASDFGLRQDEKSTKQENSQIRKARQNLIDYLEGLAPQVTSLEGEHVKVAVSEIVAMEGRVNPALDYLEIIGDENKFV